MRSSALAVLLLPALAIAQAGDPKLPAPPAKVVIIGLDGASWNVVDPLIEKGVVPTLAGLAAEGARGDFESYWPLRTPQVWTSMVTGKLPGQHGIWDHLSSTRYNPPPFRTEAKKRLTTAHRKSKALWHLLGAQGLRTLSVGWIASWPAEKAPGAVIAAPIVQTDTRRQSTIKGSFWRDTPGMLEPAAMWPRAKKWVTEPGEITRADLAPFADMPGEKSPLRKLPLMDRYLYTLRWSLARARSVEALTLGLYDAARPDVVLSYFQCSDSLAHRFWIFREGVEATKKRLAHHKIDTRHAEELVRRFENVLEACYRDVDARIGRILKRVRGPDTLVLIVTDHGFGEAPEPHPDPEEPYGGNHRDQGLVIAAGPQVPRGTLTGASVLDVTPTVLYHLGLPYGADMRGKPIAGIYPPGTFETRPPQTVPTFEKKPQKKAPYAQGWPSRKDRPLASSKP